MPLIQKNSSQLCCGVRNASEASFLLSPELALGSIPLIKNFYVFDVDLNCGGNFAEEYLGFSFFRDTRSQCSMRSLLNFCFAESVIGCFSYLLFTLFKKGYN